MFSDKVCGRLVASDKIEAAASANSVSWRHVSQQFRINISPQTATNNFIGPKMDPFSAEGELLNLHNYFHQGQWQECVDFDTSSLSPENDLPARVLSLRAQIALGHADDVIADVKGAKEPELIAVGAMAEWAAGNEEDAVHTTEKLSQESVDNGIVQVLAGTVLQAAGKSEEALSLLSKHQGNCISTTPRCYGVKAD